MHSPCQAGRRPGGGTGGKGHFCVGRGGGGGRLAGRRLPLLGGHSLQRSDARYRDVAGLPSHAYPQTGGGSLCKCRSQCSGRDNATATGELACAAAVPARTNTSATSINRMRCPSPVWLLGYPAHRGGVRRPDSTGCSWTRCNESTDRMRKEGEICSRLRRRCTCALRVDLAMTHWPTFG
jgi:hypothetical protein